jgi:hypothetical protein
MLRAAQRRVDVEALTTDDESPQHMYTLERVCESLEKSDSSASEDFAVLLLRKLESSPMKPHTLRKTLKLAEHAARKPTLSTFRSALTNRAHTIRSFTRFTGNSDPLYGDALNERIRGAANDAFAALSNSSQQPHQPVNSDASASHSSGSRSIALESVSSDDPPPQRAQPSNQPTSSQPSGAQSEPSLSRNQHSNKWKPPSTPNPPTSSPSSPANKSSTTREAINSCAGDHPEVRLLNARS